ncbi:MAG: tRNA pseudouridine(55) synthase TruB, partial [Candidatus Rokuibacteriota bacterium]
PRRPVTSRGPTPTRSGVLVVDKVAGITSFGVVAAVRRALGSRRVGHAGTLDPDALGVLPVLIGEATKLMPYLVDQDKEYVATVRWGLSTDTHDVAGRVVATAPVPVLSLVDVERACAGFVGRIEQTPPMFSAVHHEGRRLYELAREGVEVPREARHVVVRSIVVEAQTADTATLRIVCGKGTYIRVLAADLGARLGCGAAIEHLVRTRVGPFDRSTAVSWGQVVTEGGRGALAECVMPSDAALTGWPALRLTEAAAQAFLHGQAVAAEAVAGGDDRFLRVYDNRGSFLGVGERQAERVKPARILHADRSGSRELPA